MKKTLNKRLLSFVMAFTLAVSSIFSGLFEPLLSFAGEQDSVAITIDVFDVDNNESTLAVKGACKYFVSAWLTNKSDGKLAGWAIKEVNPNWQSHTDVVFDSFYPYEETPEGEEPTVPDESEKFKYDPDLYTFEYRVIYTVDWSTEVKTYEDTIDETKVIPNIPGYQPSRGALGTEAYLNLKFTEKPVTFMINFDSDKPTNFTEDDQVYVKVTVDHYSGAPTYYFEQLIGDVSGKKIEVQTLDDQNWYDYNGNSAPTERFHGSEKGLDICLVMADGTTNSLDYKKIIDKSNCAEIPNGATVKGANVSYTIGDEKKSTSGGKTVYTYDTYINFETKYNATNDFDFKSVLGDSVNVGFVADRYYQKNHSQTNYAINYYQPTSQYTEPNLSGDFGGYNYIAYIADFQNKTTVDDSTVIIGLKEDGTLDVPKKIGEDPETGDPIYSGVSGYIPYGDKHCPDGHILYTDSVKRIEDTSRVYNEETNPSGFITVIEEKPATIKSDYVQPLIDGMTGVSTQLLGKSSNYDPVFSSSKVFIDTRDYSDGATIYIDGDKIAEYLGGNTNGKIVIKAKESQTIVFNFDDTEEVTIGEYYIELLNGDGTTSYSPLNQGDTANSAVKPDGEPGSPENQWLDRVTRNVVWNLNSVKKLELNNTAGAFLVPQTDAETTITGSSSGWFNTAGYVENNAEWHYVYSGISKTPETVTSTDVSISKTGISGQGEVKGATLRIYKDTNVDAYGNVIDEAVFVKEWTSDGVTAKTFTLEDGSYYLAESGDESFTDERTGRIYTIADSMLRFTLRDGEVFVEAQDVLKSEADKNSEEAYFLFDGEKTITLCDVCTNEPTRINLDKRGDSNGKTKVNGAKFAFYNAEDTENGQPKSGATVVANWESGVGDSFVDLENGTYVLVETGGDFEYNDVTYSITNCYMTLTVNNGKVESARVTEPDEQVGNMSFEEIDGDYFVTIYDEPIVVPTKVYLSKTDVTGEKELEGATLAIYNASDVENGKPKAGTTAVKPWTSGSDEQYVELKNGSYVLIETGNEFTFDGTVYTVTDSYVTFTVNNGTVTGTATQSTTDEGKAAIDEAQAKITISDAEKTYKVFLSKTDLNGDELAGATLTIYNAEDVENGKVKADKENDFVKQWQSGSQINYVELSDGEYVLVETGDDFTIGDKTYTVTESYVSFKIENGVVTGTATQSTNDEGTAKLDTTDATQPKITIADAERVTVVTTATVNVSKKDITGQEEISGATLSLINSEIDWTDILIANETKGFETVTDSDNNVIGIKWQSERSSKAIAGLVEGTYKLKEMGDEVFDASSGKTYKIIKSELDVIIDAEGKVSVGYDDEECYKTEADKTSTKGYFMFDDASNTVTVCDAEYKTLDQLGITKKDVTGSLELMGAKMRLTGDINWNKIIELNSDVELESITNGIRWESNGEKVVIKGLPNGTYTLTEERTSFTFMEETFDGFEFKEKIYQIIPFSLTFTVEEGKVVEGSISAEKLLDTYDKDVEGYFIYDPDTQSIEMCDAVNETETQRYEELRRGQITDSEDSSDSEPTPGGETGNDSENPGGPVPGEEDDSSLVPGTDSGEDNESRGSDIPTDSIPGGSTDSNSSNGGGSSSNGGSSSGSSSSSKSDSNSSGSGTTTTTTTTTTNTTTGNGTTTNTNPATGMGKALAPAVVLFAIGAVVARKKNDEDDDK